MRIQTTASDLVAPRLRDQCLAETCHQRTDDHNRTTQRSAFTQEVVRIQIIQIDVIGLERIGIGCRMFHFHLHVAQKLNKVVYIQDIGYIVDRYFL